MPVNLKKKQNSHLAQVYNVERMFVSLKVNNKTVKKTDIFHKYIGFQRVLPVSSPNKTDSHHIAEILLKVALNTIIPTILV